MSVYFLIATGSSSESSEGKYFDLLTAICAGESYTQLLRNWAPQSENTPHALRSASASPQTLTATGFGPSDMRQTACGCFSAFSSPQQASRVRQKNVRLPKILVGSSDNFLKGKNMATAFQIEARIEALKTQLRAAREREKRAEAERVLQMMKRGGLSIVDLENLIKTEIKPSALAKQGDVA
jgi:hypothetical protein